MSGISKELTNGIFFTALAKYSSIFISILVTAILSRLLSPDEFGIIAIALVFINFFNMFSDMGIGASIIQKKDLTQEDINNIFSFTVYLGIFLALVFLLFSPFISDLYKQPELNIICKLLSINVVFASANIVPSGLLQRDRLFKFIGLRTFYIQLITGVISCMAAYCGLGIYSLLINPILSSVLIFIVNYFLYKPSFVLYIKVSSLKKIFSYSLYQCMYNIINYISYNSDKLLIGKYIGINDLGYYEKSYRLMMLPLSNINSVITPVMHPIFSMYQDNKRLIYDYYKKILIFAALIGFPLSIFLHFCSEELIVIIFGKQWEASVPVFKLLAYSVGFQIVLSTTNSIFQALNTTKSMFLCGAFSSVINIVLLLVAVLYFKSLTIVAICYITTFFLSFLQSFWLLFRHVFQVRFLEFIKIMISPIILSLLSYFLMTITNYCIFSFNINSFILSLTIKSIVFVTIWIIYVLLTHSLDFILNKKK